MRAPYFRGGNYCRKKEPRLLSFVTGRGRFSQFVKKAGHAEGMLVTAAWQLAPVRWLPSRSLYRTSQCDVTGTTERVGGAG